MGPYVGEGREPTTGTLFSLADSYRLVYGRAKTGGRLNAGLYGACRSSVLSYINLEWTF